MAQLAYVLAFLALVGAVASWITGAFFYVRTLRAVPAGPEQGRVRWLVVVAWVAWPFALGRLKGVAAEHAAKVNKALVAFFVCLLVAAAATSVATNLLRVSR